MHWIDTHAHINMEMYDADRDEVLVRATQNEVHTLIIPGFDLTSSERAVQLVQTLPNAYAAIGIHPHYAKEVEGTHPLANPVYQKLLTLAQHSPKVVAIGETGLDFYKNLSEKAAQLECFSAHIELANLCNLPIIIHHRNAEAELKAVITEHPPRHGAVLHCFTASLSLAQWAIDLGFYISLSGILTFKNAEDLRITAKALPIDRLLLETDCPYLAPLPHRGKRNEPALLVETAKCLATLKNIPLEQLAETTTQNAKHFFGLDSLI